MNKKKIVSLIISTLMILGLFSGCSGKSNKDNSTNNVNNNTNINDNSNKGDSTNKNNSNNQSDSDNKDNTNNKSDSSVSEKESFKDTYVQYIPISSDTMNYRGYAEYGYDLTLSSSNKTESLDTYTFNGSLVDGIGHIEGEPDRVFTLVYEVTDNHIKEIITNNDTTSKYADRLNSLVANHIVIKGAIEVGNSWTESTTIDGKEYMAETTITEASDTGFSTKTIIKDFSMDGKSYDEERVYEVGKGLVHFSANLDGEFFFAYSLNK